MFKIMWKRCLYEWIEAGIKINAEYFTNYLQMNYNILFYNYTEKARKWV